MSWALRHRGEPSKVRTPTVMLLESDHHGPEKVRLLLAVFSRVAHRRFLVGLVLVFAAAAALMVFVGGGNSVGATR